MMFKLRRTFTISAAHFMPNDDGPCGRVHGHNFDITIEIATDQLKEGMVVNALSLTPRVDRFKNSYDHQILNDRLEMPTIENLACEVLDRFPEATAVEIDEGLGIACRVER